jgi:hypothetical protein
MKALWRELRMLIAMELLGNAAECYPADSDEPVKVALCIQDIVRETLTIRKTQSVG